MNLLSIASTEIIILKIESKSLKTFSLSFCLFVQVADKCFLQGGQHFSNSSK